MCERGRVAALGNELGIAATFCEGEDTRSVGLILTSPETDMERGSGARCAVLVPVWEIRVSLVVIKSKFVQLLGESRIIYRDEGAQAGPASTCMRHQVESSKTAYPESCTKA